MRNAHILVVVWLAALPAAAGCGAINRMAVKSVAGTLSSGGSTAMSHDDPELIRDSMPFALTLHESLLDTIPRHEPLLTQTCALYTQYAVAFVQADAESAQFDDYAASRRITDRALTLALRGRDYCWRALEATAAGVTATLAADPEAAARRLSAEHVKLLYWSAASLGASISLGGAGRPDLLIDWPVVRALGTRALSLDEAWGNGAIHELLLTVESQGEAMGGSEERARRHFERALAIQRGQSAGPYLSLALGISKTNQDRAEFEALLGQALALVADAAPEHRLVTLIMQNRARLYLAHIDEIFMAPDLMAAPPCVLIGRSSRP